jgi:hypothetical protein
MDTLSMCFRPRQPRQPSTHPAEAKDIAMTESRHSTHGKWSQPGVPHKGWRNVDFYESADDGEDLTQVCEMCGTTRIRYVHVMEHDDHPEHLKCGCICAGRMEEDYGAAKARETRAGRRAKFAKSPRWKVAAQGNWRMSVDGQTIVQTRRWDGSYSFGFLEFSNQWSWSRTNYPSARDARMAAFDELGRRRGR